MNATPREPFDAEEARLKRAYDTLPHGEPSAALDARILGHARAAAHQAPKRRPWFLGAGLGTAAAAVFAAGIAWQLGVFEGDRNLQGVPAEAPVAEEELDRIDIEFMKQERKKDEAAAAPRVGPRPPAAPPPPPPPAAPPAVLSDAAAPAAAASRAEAPAGALEEQRQRANAAPAPQQAMPQPKPFPAEPESSPLKASDDKDAAADAREDAFADAPVATEVPSEAMDAAPLATEAASPTNASAAARHAAPEPREQADSALGAAASGAAAPANVPRAAGLAKEGALPPWAEDMRLAPDDWLERIRDRVQRGDRQGAEHSLRRFVLDHPQRRVPRDLQRLLVE